MPSSLKRKNGNTETNPKGSKRQKIDNPETPISNRNEVSISGMASINNCDLRTHDAFIVREWTDKERSNVLKPSPQVPKRFMFTKNVIKVGRDPSSSDLLLNSARGPRIQLMISRTHATIVKKGQAYYISDNSSTNGVTVNNVKLARSDANHKLRNGDQILFGRELENSEFYYKYQLLPKKKKKKPTNERTLSDCSSNDSTSNMMHLYDGPSVDSADDSKYNSNTTKSKTKNETKSKNKSRNSENEEEEDVDITQECDDSPQINGRNMSKSKKQLKFGMFPNSDDDKGSDSENNSQKNNSNSNMCKDNNGNNNNSNSSNNSNNNNNNGNTPAAAAAPVFDQNAFGARIAAQMAAFSDNLTKKFDEQSAELAQTQAKLRAKELEEIERKKEEARLQELKLMEEGKRIENEKKELVMKEKNLEMKEKDQEQEQLELEKKIALQKEEMVNESKRLENESKKQNEMSEAALKSMAEAKAKQEEASNKLSEMEKLQENLDTKEKKQLETLNQIAKDKEELENKLKEHDENADNEKEKMEDQYTCVICIDIMYKANVLNCGHSMCEQCVADWISNGNGQTCPHCRADIATRTKCIMLDGLIEDFVSKLDEAERKEWEVRKKDYKIWKDGQLAQEIAAQEAAKPKKKKKTKTISRRRSTSAKKAWQRRWW